MASACKFGDGFQSPGGWALGQLLSLYVETQEHILMAATTSNSFSIAKVPPRFGTASRKSCIFLCSVFQRKTLMLSPKFLCSSLYSRSKERHHCPGHWPTQQWGSRYSLENNSIPSVSFYVSVCIVSGKMLGSRESQRVKENDVCTEDPFLICFRSYKRVNLQILYSKEV